MEEDVRDIAMGIHPEHMNEFFYNPIQIQMEYSRDDDREDFNIKDIGKPFKKAGEALKDAGSKAGEVAKDAGSKAGEIAKGAGSKIKDTATGVGGKIKGGASRAFDAVKSFGGTILNVFKKIWEFLKKFKVWLIIACVVCLLSLLSPILGPLFGFGRIAFGAGQGLFGLFSSDKKSTVPAIASSSISAGRGYDSYAGQGYNAGQSYAGRSYNAGGGQSYAGQEYGYGGYSGRYYS